ncbi:MAG: PQQ-binding-like beta-propeller repeat protein, partial [Armatimonadota bacterium]
MNSQHMLIEDEGNVNLTRISETRKHPALKCGVVALALVWLSAGGASAQDWLKYHKDPANTGATTKLYNPGIDNGSNTTTNVDNGSGVVTSTGLQPGWTYPWPARDDTADSQATVDDQVSDAAIGAFTSTAPAWIGSASITLPDTKASNAYSNHYWFSHVLTPVSNSTTNTESKASHATWTFGTGVTADWYRIEVFFPSGTETMTRTVNGETQTYTPGNTDHAKYLITDANGDSHTVIISQSGGGSWVPLGGGRYRMGPGSTIKLSNWSAASENTGLPGPVPSEPVLTYTDEGRLVKADAVRLVRDYGSIYSSPAVYTPGFNSVSATRAVVVGQVLADPFNRQATVEINWGRITAIDALNGPGRSGNLNNKVFNKPMWEYPKADGRAPNEGPIAGGVYSSPLVDAGVVYIGADDGQIYALDQNDGHLIWNGPGATIDNDVLSLPKGATFFSYNNSAFDTVTRAGDDFFGQTYHTAEAKASGANSCDYKFQGLQDYFYQVYAWIPAPDGDKEWAQNVKYTVKPGSGTEVTTLANQSSCADEPELQGPRWVKIGNPVFAGGGTLEVKVYEEASGTPCGSGKTLSVVADAIRVVPEYVAAFGYCSPSVAGTRIFCSNSGGRIIALDKTNGNIDAAPNSTSTGWIWPQTRQAATGTFDDVSLGGMIASVAITPSGNELFFGSITGRYGKLTGIGGAKPTDAEYAIHATDGADLTVGGFSSSPMLDGSFVYWASLGGKIYKASQSSGDSDWIFPDDYEQFKQPDGMPPLGRGAFRYSTPAKAEVDGEDYIVAGSSDGNLYEIPIDGSSTGVGVYSSSGPIYSSPATAPSNGSSLPSVAFFGTETSIFAGVSLDVLAKEFTDPTGVATEPTPPTEWGWSTNGKTVVSSPAIALGKLKNWIYVGADEGRLYAFAMQNGGAGEEGGWPYGDPDVAVKPPGASRDATKNRGSIFFDMEIVNETDYNDPAAYFAQIGLDPAAGAGAGRHPNGDPFTGNPVRLEWGDTIRMIAWSFLGNNGQINAEFQNKGSAGSAGSLETLAQVANEFWPTDRDLTITYNGNSYTGRYYYARITWPLESTKLLTPGTGYAIKGFITGGANNQPLEAFVPSGNLASTSTQRRNNTPRDFTVNHPIAVAFNSDSIA